MRQAKILRQVIGYLSTQLNGHGKTLIMFRVSYLATAIGPPRCWLIVWAHVTVGRWPASRWEAARLAEGRKFESWWRQSFFQHKFWSHNLLQLKFPLIFLPQTTLWQHVGKLCQLSPGISQEHVKFPNSGHRLFSMNCHSTKWLLHRLSQNHHKWVEMTDLY